MIFSMTKGIHHITAIASDAKKTLQFYSHILGLRLVKKTVNQDDVGAYHLFFGDKYGHPGMDLTFFIFQRAMVGSRGNGLVTNISLTIAEHSLLFWKNRFLSYGVKHQEESARFGKRRIRFFDGDDQQLELVGVSDNELHTNEEVWITEEISKENAIQSFHSATLSVVSKHAIEPILTHVFGYRSTVHKDNTYLYEVSNSTRGNFLEVCEQPSEKVGLNAVGTVHHIAFRASDENEQDSMRQRVLELGLYPTDVIDRFYFKSVYFRTPAGILFEIATEGPGFTVDEKEKQLGKKLALPPFLQKQRDVIEKNLPTLEI